MLTTRLHRQYYKAGQQQGSPDISKVYYHVNPFCIRVTFPSFEPNLCRIPSSPRTQKDDRTKACCEVLVGLWSVVMSPYHVPTISKHQTLKTKTFLLLLTTLNCRIWDCYFTISYDTDYNDAKFDYESYLWIYLYCIRYC